MRLPLSLFAPTREKARLPNAKGYLNPTRVSHLRSLFPPISNLPAPLGRIT